MAYIKISDPNIIDLSAWHQVINVVNQHSDSITAITNNFGTNATGTLDYTGYTFINEFNPGNQKIIYGRTNASNISGGGRPATSYDGSTQIYYGSVSFTDATAATTAFSAMPIVTVTSHSGNTSGSVSGTNKDALISVYNVTQTGFNYRVIRTGTTPTLAGDVHLNWVAIGPR